MGKDNLEILPPDNPTFIFVDSIAYVAKAGDGCLVMTVDGSKFHFHATSYEQMKAKFAAVTDFKTPEHQASGSVLKPEGESK